MIATVITKCWFSPAMLTSPHSFEQQKQPFVLLVQNKFQVTEQKATLCHKSLADLKNTSLVLQNKQIEFGSTHASRCSEANSPVA
jgi:hypothetical protein